jgi:hypothetical protein
MRMLEKGLGLLKEKVSECIHLGHVGGDFPMNKTEQNVASVTVV